MTDEARGLELVCSCIFFLTGVTKKAIALTGIKLVRSRYYESAIYLSD
ncbi:hypothetical protein QUB30_23615 [Microcoleus sp. BROC3]